MLLGRLCVLTLVGFSLATYRDDVEELQDRLDDVSVLLAEKIPAREALEKQLNSTSLVWTNSEACERRAHMQFKYNSLSSQIVLLRAKYKIFKGTLGHLNKIWLEVDKQIDEVKMARSQALNRKEVAEKNIGGLNNKFI